MFGRFACSVDQSGARRLLQRCGERTIFVAAGAGEPGDAVQVVLRLIAVALFDLPEAVILPGAHVGRVGLERALVPDLRDLVVAELAIGIADQVGDVGAVVVAERLELRDRRGVVLDVIDRRIGGAITAEEARLRVVLPAAVDQLVVLAALGALAALAVGGRGRRRPGSDTPG